MESLSVEFFQFFAKIIKRFALSSLLGIRLYLETFLRFSPDLLNLQWPMSAEVEIKLFCISRDHIINESRDSVGEIPSP